MFVEDKYYSVCGYVCACMHNQPVNVFVQSANYLVYVKSKSLSECVQVISPYV